MIKTFEQFINENYNEKNVITDSNVYGFPIFNEISESLMSNIKNSINEGIITIDMNMVEEGLFDSVANLFKKGADKMNKKEKDKRESMNDTITGIEYFTQLTKQSPNKSEFADEIETLAKQLQLFDKESKVYAAVEDLCNLAVDICEKISEKEENMYSTISEKMTAANDAIKEFTEKSIDKIKKIVEESKNKVSDIIFAVAEFCRKMIEFAKNALEVIGKGIVIGFTLPFIFAYSVYKGALKICEMFVEKIKDGADVVKETFNRIKTAISNWIVESLKNAKDILKEANKSIVDGSKKTYKAIAKSYLTIVALLGQLASDAKDMISEYYSDFIESAKEFEDDVKAYISKKWDVVSKWYKKTSTSFAEGVKNVWDKMKEKVTSAIDSVNDAYKILKDNADATWNDIQDWNDDRKQEIFKAQLKYGVDEWGKDVVASWVDAL